jgi:UDP-glucose 4-epimerase
MVLSGFAQSRILVVGGAGFIGSNLCLRLLEAAPARLIIVDNLLSAEAANVPEGNCVDFVHGSITNDRLLSALPDDLDYVFSLATYHGNQSSIKDPLADHENNTLTTLKLLERVRAMRGLKKIVYASAGCTVAQKTFDTAEATRENDPISLYLDSPYQISKIIGEFYGNYYFKHHGVPFVKARFQNVYGPGEILGAGQWRGTPATVWRNVTPTFIWKALHGESLPVEGGGITTRDFIYVDDIVEGLIACAVSGKAGEVYNLASGLETSIRELAELVNELTGHKATIALRPVRSWDRSGKRYGDPSKARSELGFCAKVALRDGIARTITWTRRHRDIIRQAIMRHDRLMREAEPP